MRNNPTEVWLEDPALMRALSHPIRLQLLGELRRGGPRTVGGLGDAIDEPPGSVSYHVGVLAKHGLVEEVPEMAKDRRERWWRAVHERTRWESQKVIDPESRTALAALRRSILDRYAEELSSYFEREPTLPAEWIAAGTSSDEILHLTSDQLAGLKEDLGAVAAKWVSRSDRDAEGAQNVALIYHAFRR